MNEKKSMPIPRIKGRAVEREDKRWVWEIEVHIGDSEECVAMTYPESGPGFETKELAIVDLKSHAQGVADTISKDVFGQEPVGYMDLIKNEMTNKI